MKEASTLKVRMSREGDPLDSLKRTHHLQTDNQKGDPPPSVLSK